MNKLLIQAFCNCPPGQRGIITTRDKLSDITCVTCGSSFVEVERDSPSWGEEYDEN